MRGGPVSEGFRRCFTGVGGRLARWLDISEIYVACRTVGRPIKTPPVDTIATPPRVPAAAVLPTRAPRI